jgi:hypothetical protein
MTYTNESVARLVDSIWSALEAHYCKKYNEPVTTILEIASISKLDLKNVLSSLTLETPRVCEWKDGSSRRGGPECFESGCGMTYSYGTRKTFKFCPYCGGEIKEATLTIEVPE